MAENDSANINWNLFTLDNVASGNGDLSKLSLKLLDDCHSRHARGLMFHSETHYKPDGSVDLAASSPYVFCDGKSVDIAFPDKRTARIGESFEEQKTFDRGGHQASDKKVYIPTEIALTEQTTNGVKRIFDSLPLTAKTKE